MGLEAIAEERSDHPRNRNCDYRFKYRNSPLAYHEGGKPCIRGLRITVYDVLEHLASGMTHQQILSDFPYLTEEDIRACLAFAGGEATDPSIKLQFSFDLLPRDARFIAVAFDGRPQLH